MDERVCDCYVLHTIFCHVGEEFLASAGFMISGVQPIARPVVRPVVLTDGPAFDSGRFSRSASPLLATGAPCGKKDGTCRGGETEDGHLSTPRVPCTRLGGIRLLSVDTWRIWDSYARHIHQYLYRVVSNVKPFCMKIPHRYNGSCLNPRHPAV